MSVFWNSLVTVGGNAVISDRVSVTPLADSGFVVARTAVDGDFDAVFQIFNADGTARGSSIVANVPDDFSQSDVQVLALPDGGFAVLWQNAGSISIRRFTASGEPEGELISFDGVADAEFNAIALNDGSIAITYLNPISSFDNDVALRIVSPEWDISSQIVVSDVEGSQSNVRVVSAGSGLLVVWNDNNGTAGDVMARWFSGDGTGTGTTQVINARTELAQNLGAVTSLADGRVLVVWADFTGQGRNTVLRGRILNPDATFATGELVLPTSFGAPTVPNAVGLADGGFVISFASAANQEHRLIRFDRDGSQLGGEITLGINGGVAGFVDEVGLSLLEDGRLATAWTSSTGVVSRIIDYRDGLVFGDDEGNALFGNNLLGDLIQGEGGDDFLDGLGGVDFLTGGLGNDVINGGSNVDTAIVRGLRSAYTITQTETGVFEVVGPDGTDTLTAVEFLQFDDQTIRLLPGTGVSVNFNTSNPAAYQTAMNAIRDFDGNALGGNGSWLRIGQADVNGDGDIDQILVNRAIGRFATVGTAPDGLVYFMDFSWAGETRVAGIYIDPLVAAGIVERFGPNDSQRRFQNDLQIENINRVLGADDYDNDGLQEVYLALTDGTAYLRAIMEFDGNIRYANYQSQQEVIDYLTANGFGPDTWAGWFGNGGSSGEAALGAEQVFAVQETGGRGAIGAPAADLLAGLGDLALAPHNPYSGLFMEQYLRAEFV